MIVGQEGAEQQRHELAERQIQTGARHEVGLSWSHPKSASRTVWEVSPGESGGKQTY